MQLLRLISLLAALLLCVPACAQDTARLDRWLNDLDAAGLAMGTLAVSPADGPIRLRPLGMAQLEPARAAKADTRYRIGSISKLFTAVLVLQLVEEGRLKLDAPISTWFPAVPLAGQITVEHLLAHRSGLGDIKDLPGFEDQWMLTPRTDAELVQAIAGLPRAFAPGERAEYNNSGYVLLSLLVERIERQPFAQVLARRVTGPLNLRDTALDADAVSGPRDARSYRWADGRDPPAWALQRDTHPSVARGAGALRATPRDLVVFIRALFEGRLLKPATRERMLQVRDGFGLGIYRIAGPGSVAWGHEGMIDGSASALIYQPETGLALAWCGNAHRVTRDDILQLARSAIADASAPLPDYRMRDVRVRFAVDLGPAGRATPPASVGLRGSSPPLNWRSSAPLSFDAATGLWSTELTLPLREGLPLEYKYLVTPAAAGPRAEERWERTPNRRLTAPPATTAGAEGVATSDATLLDYFDHDAQRSALMQEILAADGRLFGAFNTRDLATIGQMFSERLEFFHDRNGLSGYAENMRSFERAFKRPGEIGRELVPGTSEVFALGSFGALHTANHRFCNTREGRSECGDFRFSHVWERTPAGWKLLRVISYDH